MKFRVSFGVFVGFDEVVEWGHEGFGRKAAAKFAEMSARVGDGSGLSHVVRLIEKLEEARVNFVEEDLCGKGLDVAGLVDHEGDRASADFAVAVHF